MYLMKLKTENCFFILKLYKGHSSELLVSLCTFISWRSSIAFDLSDLAPPSLDLSVIRWCDLVRESNGTRGDIAKVRLRRKHPGSTLNTWAFELNFAECGRGRSLRVRCEIER